MPERLFHSIPPFYTEDSTVLILGSFPSPKSREVGFPYGHPQNRFWPTLARVFEGDTPKTVEEKKRFLLKNRIALWDVLASCEIVGADDASIRNPLPNDIPALLARAPRIGTIYTTGGKAAGYFRRFFPELTARHVALPSTSAANRALWTDDRLFEAYRVIRNDK